MASKTIGPARIILWIAILAAVIVIVREVSIRKAYDTTFAVIGDAIESAETSQSGIYKTDVDVHIHGSPVRTSSSATLETVTWNGLLQTYELRITYGPKGMILRVE